VVNVFVVEKNKNGVMSLPAKEIKVKQLKTIGSELAKNILDELAKKPSYPMQLAKKLGINEQKIYYHIRNLEKARIIEIIRNEEIKGSMANVYDLTEPAFVVKFKDFKTTSKIKELEEHSTSFLEPFIEDGQLNAKIIVGSPDPHGPEKARSRDGYYGMDLALFLGTFLNYVPGLNVKLDTETRQEDLQHNLILIGGPAVNSVTEKVNPKLPVRFDKNNNWCVVSDVTGKKYHSDEMGVIAKIKSPFNKRKKVLVVAGKRYAGTRGVMIALLKHFKEVIAGNKFDKNIEAKVIEGIDMDSDGIVDDIEFKE
jgi:DNA-binding PadR family transcriptional regulator